MKKVLLVISVAILFTSCFRSRKLVPLSSVNSEPVLIESKLSKEIVWEKLVDYFATAGTSIKLIDKSSGLMITEDYSFKNSAAYENKKGEVSDPMAYVIYKKRGKFGPQTITGQWNARIKDKVGGGSIININIVNLKAYRIDANQYGTSYMNFNAASSKVFEKEIANLVK